MGLTHREYFSNHIELSQSYLSRIGEKMEESLLQQFKLHSFFIEEYVLICAFLPSQVLTTISLLPDMIQLVFFHEVIFLLVCLFLGTQLFPMWKHNSFR